MLPAGATDLVNVGPPPATDLVSVAAGPNPHPAPKLNPCEVRAIENKSNQTMGQLHARQRPTVLEFIGPSKVVVLNFITRHGCVHLSVVINCFVSLYFRLAAKDPKKYSPAFLTQIK